MGTNYVTRDKHGMYAGKDGLGHSPGIMGIYTLVGNSVHNAHGEELGSIEDFMVEMATGAITYALISFDAVSGMQGRLFAVPWSALLLDGDRHRFLLHLTREALKDAPGFHTDQWPSMADPRWAQEIHRFYGTTYRSA